MAGLTLDRRALAAAAVLAGTSLGLPWGTREVEMLGETPFILTFPGGDATVTTLFTLDLGVDVPLTVYGFQHPMRVFLAIAVVLMWRALVVRSRRIAGAAVAAAAGALLFAGSGAVAGPLVLAAGALVAALGIGWRPPIRSRTGDPESRNLGRRPAASYSDSP